MNKEEKTMNSITTKAKGVVIMETKTRCPAITYQKQVSNKLYELRTGLQNHVGKEQISTGSSVAHVDYTIRYGKLQEILYNVAFFQHAHIGGVYNKPVGAALVLAVDCTWEQVWDLIKDIKEIRIEVEGSKGV